MQIIIPILETELTKNGVSSLADRPNQPSTYGTGGLSAQELKARFDSLSKLSINKINEILSVLRSENATEYIGVGGKVAEKLNCDNLKEVLLDIVDGSISSALLVETSSGEKIPLNSSIQQIERKISEVEENKNYIFDGYDGAGLTGNASTGTALRLPSTGVYFLKMLPGAGIIVNVDGTNNLVPFYVEYSTDSSGTSISQHYLLIAQDNSVKNVSLVNGTFIYQSTYITYKKIG